MQHHDLLQHASLVQPADAIEMLKADHRRVHKLFQSYEATNEPAMQQRIAMALFVALELYMQVEETVFYPPPLLRPPPAPGTPWWTPA
jgi:hypothetical protein